MYALDPLNGTAEFGISRAEQELVIGGEASLWGEEIDASNLAQRAWPRGSAFAERMWSQKSVNDAIEFSHFAARALEEENIPLGIERLRQALNALGVT